MRLRRAKGQETFSATRRTETVKTKKWTLETRRPTEFHKNLIPLEYDFRSVLAATTTVAEYDRYHAARKRWLKRQSPRVGGRGRDV